jgi:predicted P-loop ATPase/GTPase
MEFPSFMTNSALMQSYSLMKMSSEVTKTPSYYPPQDRSTEFPKQQIEFNRNMLPQKPAPMQTDKMDPFLGKLFINSLSFSWHQAV